MKLTVYKFKYATCLSYFRDLSTARKADINMEIKPKESRQSLSHKPALQRDFNTLPVKVKFTAFIYMFTFLMKRVPVILNYNKIGLAEGATLYLL